MTENGLKPLIENDARTTCMKIKDEIDTPTSTRKD